MAISDNELIGFVLGHLPTIRARHIKRLARRDQQLQERISEFQAVSSDLPKVTSWAPRLIPTTKGNWLVASVALFFIVIGSGAAIPQIRNSILTLVMQQPNGEIHLQITVDSGTRIELDGEVISDLSRIESGILSVDPGSHEIVLIQDGELVMRQSIVTKPGERIPIRRMMTGETVNVSHGYGFEFANQYSLSDPPKELRSLAFRDAKSLLVGSGNYAESGTIYTIDLTSSEKRPIQSYENGIPSIASSSELTAWSTWKANKVFVKSKTAEHSANLDATTRVAVHEDTVVTAGEDGTVAVWDARMKRLAGWKVDTILHSVAITSGGTRIVAGGGHFKEWGEAENYGRVYVWDLSGKLIHTLTAHEASVLGVAASPDGVTIISAGVDKSVRFWDAKTGNLVRTIREHENIVESVACSPDGVLAASGGWDTRVLVWRVASGELIATLQRHTSQVKSLAFSPGGKKLASVGSDGLVIVWNIQKHF